LVKQIIPDCCPSSKNEVRSAVRQVLQTGSRNHTVWQYKKEVGLLFGGEWDKKNRVEKATVRPSLRRECSGMAWEGGKKKERGKTLTLANFHLGILLGKGKKRVESRLLGGSQSYKKNRGEERGVEKSSTWPSRDLLVVFRAAVGGVTVDTQGQKGVGSAEFNKLGILQNRQYRRWESPVSFRKKNTVIRTGTGRREGKRRISSRNFSLQPRSNI